MIYYFEVLESISYVVNLYQGTLGQDWSFILDYQDKIDVFSSVKSFKFTETMRAFKNLWSILNYSIIHYHTRIPKSNTSWLISSFPKKKVWEMNMIVKHEKNFKSN